jgi:PKD repeat protein
VFVSGAFGGNLNFGNGISLTNTATNAPFVNAFVAKYNSLGVIQWAEEAGGTNGGDYFDIALDGQTNIYAAGGLISGAAVSKFSPAGTLQWTYAANGPPANPVGSIVTKCAVDTAGHCYLAGWYQGGTAAFGTNTLQPQETLNFFLAETVTNPTVQFSASPASSLPPLTVQFNSTNVDSQGNTISSWKWNFGDGTTTNTQNPSHTYTNVATFYPSFVATNISGVSVIGFGPLITTTNISAANPTIQFTANPTNGLPPLAVQFNSSNVDSLGNAITSWNWNFGDGTTTNTQNPLHTYTIANIFLPSLTATNSRGVAVVGNGPQIATLTPTPSTCFSYTINNGAITITGYTCSGGAVNIPSMINGLPVTVIGAAFENNNNVTSVTIPDSVTSIGDHAFDSCYNLTSVTIGNSVTHIGEWAFSVCNLTNVTIPNSVTSIGDGAFNDCPLLTNVTIPNSITSIGGEMFRYCGLTSIMIPQSVTSIGSSAFEYCDSLTSITIPNSVTSIGSSAFADCTGLKAAYFQGNAPSADCTVFQGDSVTVYYLPGMTGWGSSFACVPTAAWILQVATTNLPRGTNGVPYSQQLSAIYGQTPYTWTNISGALPPGLTLAANGVISGTPMSGGTNNFTVKVTDALSATATQALMLTVVGPPIITIQPTNNSIWVPVGSNVTFSVSVSGTGPFSYQWRLNSNNLPNGIITTVAGGGHGGQNGLGDGLGDGGAATDATLWNPFGVAVDVTGNLFIADQANYRIRKVGITGIINTVAGNGSYAGTGTGDYSGDGSAATNAELFFPDGVAVDAAGNLFIADSYNNVIRKVVLPRGSTLVLNDVGFGNAGAYDVVVSGPYGSVTSSVVNVVVTLPVILSSPQITVGKTNFTFQLSGPAGSNYVLQVSTNLLNWDPISTSAIPVSGSINLTNTMSGYKQSFYQVHLQ